jgi:hypothetical protein
MNMSLSQAQDIPISSKVEDGKDLLDKSKISNDISSRLSN